MFVALRAPQNAVAPKISSTGAWIIPENYKYFLDKKLAPHLAELFRASTVLELGGGEGHYSKYFREAGIVDNIVSYDGAPNIAEVTGGQVKTADLSVQQRLPMMDWVLCTEVGEHVPAEFEEVLVQNIVRHARVGVLLSWALPSQTGHGHVNLLTNRQVVDMLAKYHYCLLPETSQRVREGAGFLALQEDDNGFRPWGGQ